MAEFDAIIKDGTIVDGTMVPPFKADVAIKDGKIAKIGYLKSGAATRVFDASGLIVAPGVIDLHCHYDAPVFWDPACSIGSWHGVTSVTNGNCGFGFAPVHAKDADRAMLSMERNEAIPYEAMKASMPFTWETFPQWMNHIERLPKAVNMIQLVPVTPLVSYVMGGYEEAKSRRPSEKEMARMTGIIDEAMAAGANGWAAQRLLGAISVQRDYDGTLMVSDVMPDEFYLDLAKALRKYDRGHIQFAQASGNLDEGVEGPRSDIDFAGRLAEASNRPLIFNAVVPIEKRPDVFRAQLAVIDEYNKKGVPLVGHALTAPLFLRCCLGEKWTFFDNVDVWRESLMGTFEERIGRLTDPGRRQQMKEIYDKSKQPRSVGDISHFICRKIQNEDLRAKYQDRTAGDIAKAEGRHIIDVVIDISAADGWKTQWQTPAFNSSPDHCKEMLAHRTVAGFSDGGAHAKFQTLGMFPTDLLSRLVRDAGVITLEQAHYHLSYMPAWVAGFKDRGAIREGFAADILVYDLDKLAIEEPESVYDLPPNNDSRLVQRPRGYRWIMVNGQVAFEEGKDTKAYPGKLVRCA
jgi:N-acyl-D-aspartate/D-glutamate deacylase